MQRQRDAERGEDQRADVGDACLQRGDRRDVLDLADHDVLGVPADHRGGGGEDGEGGHRVAQPGLRPLARVTASRASGRSGWWSRVSGPARSVLRWPGPVAAGFAVHLKDGHGGPAFPSLRMCSGWAAGASAGIDASPGGKAAGPPPGEQAEVLPEGDGDPAAPHARGVVVPGAELGVVELG